MPGPQKKPGKIRTLQGNPGKLPINQNADEWPEAMNLKPPDFLDIIGKKMWKKILETAPQGMIRAADLPAVGACAHAFSEWIYAIEIINVEGRVIETKSGYMQPSPYVAICNNSRKEFMRFIAQFGMTPSSREGVTIGQISKEKTGPNAEALGFG